MRFVFVGDAPHWGADRTKEPDANGRYPTKQFRKGETLVSDTDLVKVFGPDKFQYADGAAGRRSANAAVDSAAFPGGQVHTGHQQTDPDGTSGPASQRVLDRATRSTGEDVFSTMSDEELRDYVQEESGDAVEEGVSRSDLLAMARKQ